MQKFFVWNPWPSDGISCATPHEYSPFLKKQVQEIYKKCYRIFQLEAGFAIFSPAFQRQATDVLAISISISKLNSHTHHQLMKKTITLNLLAFSVIFMTACTSPAKDNRMAAMANPSSQYCVSVGGQSFSKKDAGGNEVGYCRLPDGQVVDAWDFFRKNNPPRNNTPAR